MSISFEELRRGIKEILREEKQSGPQQPAESHVDHAVGCPDCYKGIIERMNLTSDFACDHCGLPLGSEAFAKKLVSCPNCGRTELRKVER